MILIDSSAWIEYYRPVGDPATAELVERALQNDEAAINGLILVEVEGFARDEDEQRMIREDFGGCHFLPLADTVFRDAAGIAFDARRKGLPIPATDCIIAASAIASQASLVHRDKHFREIAKFSSLDQSSSLAAGGG
ncbi:MAG: type II toxin-antitoxin system VapC family toxin [Rectinemataceae bacterium]